MKKSQVKALRASARNSRNLAAYCSTHAGCVVINGVNTFVSPAETVQISVKLSEPWRGFRVFVDSITSQKARAIADPIWEQMWLSLIEEETDGGQFEDCMKSLRRLQGSIAKSKLDSDVKHELANAVRILVTTKRGQRLAYSFFKEYQRQRYSVLSI